MKEKIFAVLFACIVLSLTPDFWIVHNDRAPLPENITEKKEQTLQNEEKTDLNVRSPFAAKFKKHTRSPYRSFAPKIKIAKSCYHFAVTFFFSYYLMWFLLHSLKHGFPKDDPALPEKFNLEFLRGVFLMAIVLYHMALVFNFYSVGRFGVEFFFILSGFLFNLTYDKTPSLTVFMKRKIIRFIPLIMICSILRGLFLPYFNFSALTADWFFWGFGIISGKQSYCGEAWYISVLFWITSLYFYLLKHWRKENSYLLIGVFSFLGYLACSRLGWTIMEGMEEKGYAGFMIPQAFARGAGGIGLGFMIGLLYSNRNENKSFLMTGQYTLAEILLLTLPCVSMFFRPMNPSNPMLFVLCYAGLIYLFAVKKGYVSSFFDKPVFAKISRYFPAVYLSHKSISLFGLAYFNLWPDKFSSFLSGFVIYLLVIFSVAFIVHHAFELPAVRFLKKITE